MNMGAHIFIWLAYTSSGIFLIKPLSYKNVRWCSHFCSVLNERWQPLSAGLRHLNTYAPIFIIYFYEALLTRK